MTNLAKEVTQVNIEDELKQSYLDYAMSVIVGRALPDVRDGLKPVHRRVLFAMRELGNDWNKPYKKSARVVGDVIGKYHPHGDTAVYDTIVRMAQPFSMRYLLVDGQGNFGSVDGDSPAAMRYTEVRMSKFAHSLLSDLDKETVDFVPNYDESEWVPVVLPTRIPNLLVNGSSGIAVGMATNIPPHNLTEVINACLALIDEPTLDIDQLMEYIPGPDFPTAGIVNGRAGIVSAYRTGRGSVIMRARSHIETDEKTGKDTIVVTELPYQVNKARLIEKIAELVKEKKIEGITELRDESDKDGMRIAIEVRRGEMTDVLLNNLFVQTQMQSSFGINMVALVDGQPKLLNLKEVVQAFIRHRQEVVTRRTIFELRKARERAHILEGLGVALTNIDEMIALIKASGSPSEAKQHLMAKNWAPGIVKSMLEATGSDASRVEGLAEGYGLLDKEYRLSNAQVDAILELKLHRLTGLEQEKIIEEYRNLLTDIKRLLDILGDFNRLMQVIREELIEMRDQFGDARRTEINDSYADVNIEDLIAEEDMAVTLSQEGYVKAQPVSAYQAQHRGGRGKAATSLKEEDIIEKLIVASTHATMLCFSNFGKVYWKKVYEFPQASRASRGRPINNLLPLEEGESITAMLPVRQYDEEHFVFMATSAGVVKKTSLEAFSRPRAGGIIALELDEGDKLIAAALTDGKKEVMLFSDAGKAVRFNETNVRSMGRTARGVRGMKIQPKQKVISLLIVPNNEGQILTATERGYGKRTVVSEYRTVNRGAQGVVSIQTTARNGKVVSAIWVEDAKQVMLITNGGVLVRTRASEISLVGRNTQGVRLINLGSGESLVAVQPVDEIEGVDESFIEAETDSENAEEAVSE
ncbi:MAG: gyrA [Gammaproteobacteria bacterium]|jgi:DNA gyrase subunit A|nr:gyrA [Gammaproteobacteria bacterium]